jgi:hypothetical protein
MGRLSVRGPWVVARWVFVVPLTVPLPAVAFFVAWLHQI